MSPVVKLLALVIVILVFVACVRIRSTKHAWDVWRQTPVCESTKSENICIIGGGLSGMSASYFIGKKRNITLYEQNNRLGGNNYSSSTKTRFPLRYGVSLKKHSPALMALTRQLGDLEWIDASNELCVRLHGSPAHITHLDIVAFLPTFFKTFWGVYASDRAMTRPAYHEMNVHTAIFRKWVRPVGGINMFADRCTVANLSADQVSSYIQMCRKGFVYIKGGNHRLIDRLQQFISRKVQIQMETPVYRIVRRNDNRFVVHNQVYDAVVVSVQPHVAKRMIDPSFRLHHALLDCFETVRAYSCLHEDHSLFNDVDIKKDLVYDDDGSHHYLHIDVHWYGLATARTYYVSYWYDSAPMPVSEETILERSDTVLSRIKAKRRYESWCLLMRLKTEHENLHLINAAYSGWMWHEDAVSMAHALSRGFHA